MIQQERHEQALAKLRELIETAVDRKMRTPKDFDFLSEQIFDKLHETVSPTTLKRLWGYLQEQSVPRQSTLDVLAQFVDFKDWDAFCGQMVPQEGPTPVPFWQRLMNWKVLISLAAVVLALVVGGIMFLPSKDKKKEPGEFMADYYLKKGTHFNGPKEYLELFGIYDFDFYWGRQLTNYPGIFIWGPEYKNPTWGNLGDSAALMPTITDRWTEKYVTKEEIDRRNSELYYLSLHRNEIRITFMKNLVDSGYVFLGVYRLSKTESDSTHTVWERVQDDVYLHNLNTLYEYLN